MFYSLLNLKSEAIIMETIDLWHLLNLLNLLVTVDMQK